MNSRVLLYAIAGAEEQYLRESEQFSEIAASFQARRKRTRGYAAAVGLTCLKDAAAGISALFRRSLSVRSSFTSCHEFSASRKLM